MKETKHKLTRDGRLYYWCQVMKDQGRELFFRRGKVNMILLIEEGDIISVGISVVSMQDAIHRCRERFGIRNLEIMIRQEINMDEVRRILNLPDNEDDIS